MVKTPPNITNPVDTDSSVIKDIYDEYRPPKGIRYNLSQTEANLIANLTRINLKHTTVEYERGLFKKPVEPPEPKKRYVKRKYKGPVWIFNEEKEEKKHLETQEIIRNIRQQKTMKLEQQKQQLDKELQHAIKDSMGPNWYHEMSTLQMKSADALKQAMLKDKVVGTIQNTVDCLIQLGLVLLPNFTKVKYAFKKCYEYPVQFLLLLFKLNRPKEPEFANCYSLNDRIILSAVAHLSMRETLRELHLRTPSPSRPQIKCTRTKKKKIKINRKMTCQSPYLKPTIFKPQYKNKWIFQRRQYAELEYFDYVEDLYEVTYEETIKEISGVSVGSSTKFDKPPKIRVRLTDKFKTKRRLVTLKKPSSYECPCIISKLDKKQKPVIKEPKPAPPEIVAEESPAPPKTELDHFCKCDPKDYTKKSQFELNIEVTTSNEVLNLTQKLKPFDPENPVEELKLKGVIRIKTHDENASKEVELGIKHVDYSCECCICKKPINLYDSNNKISDQIKKCHSLSESTLPIIKEFAEEYGELFEGWAGEGEEEINVCRCPSVETVKTDIFADLDDDYHSCTCKPKVCTCCICETPDPEFLLKLQRYNAINKTNYKPCVCACACKKNKNSGCCKKKKAKEEPGCKYCFCTSKPPVNQIYEEIEKNLISETKNKKKKNVMMGGAQLLKKKTKPKTLEELIYEEENAISALPDNMEDMEMEANPERCACAKLFAKFLHSHYSCVDLYKNYQNKMKLTMQQYLEETADMCTCGDSHHELSHKGEGEDDVLEKKKEETCECLQAVQDNQKKKKKQTIEGCTCGEESVSEEYSLNYCRCSHPQIVEVSQEETTSAKSEKADEEKPLEDTTNTSSTMPSKTEMVEIVSINPAEEKQQNDAKIFVLKKFPKNRKQQMILLKQVLAALAEDNYPLANLPDCHKLPHFKVWLDKRARKYISWKDRDEFYKLSKRHWNYIQVMCPMEDIPETGFTTNSLRKITFAGVHKYQAMLNSRKTDYYRRLKQVHIQGGQQMFPPCFHYPLPTKTFRDVFFAYLPSDENHCHTIKPWEKHEYKDLRKRVPCVC